MRSQPRQQLSDFFQKFFHQRFYSRADSAWYMSTTLALPHRVALPCEKIRRKHRKDGDYVPFPVRDPIVGDVLAKEVLEHLERNEERRFNAHAFYKVAASDVFDFMPFCHWWFRAARCLYNQDAAQAIAKYNRHHSSPAHLNVLITRNSIYTGISDLFQTVEPGDISELSFRSDAIDRDAVVDTLQLVEQVSYDERLLPQPTLDRLLRNYPPGRLN